MGRRRRTGPCWAAATAAMLVLVTTLSASASASASASTSASAAIEVTVLADARVQADDGTCDLSVVVSTTAFFSEGVRVSEVRVELSGGVPGKFDQHRHATKVNDDTFNLQWDVGQFRPGDYTVTVTWSVHNGNGLSRANGTAETGLEIRPDPGIVKLGTETKCEMEKQAWRYGSRALDLRAHAEQIRDGCPNCAAYLDSVAAGDDALADIAASLALDPPDPDFTTVTTAVAPSMPSVPAGGGVSAPAAAAFHDLNARQAEAFGQARAALSAIERAQGAHLGGDSTWESRQSLAAAGFLTALATQLERLSGASAALAAQLTASGFPNPTADQAGVRAVAADTRKNGPRPLPGFPNWHRDQAGLSDAAIKGIAVRQAVAAARFDGQVSLLDTLTDARFNASVAATVTALRADAAALDAQPLLNHAGAETPGAPATTTPPATSPAAAEQPSLVGNAGFEAPALPGGSSYQTLTAGREPTLTGWRLEGSVDLVAAGGGRAATGGQFVDLSGNDTGAGPGVITQDIAVSPGHTYRLSFQLAGNPNGSPPVKTVQVSFGDQQKTFTFDTTGHTNDDLGWTTQTMELLADCDASSVTLSFASQTEGSRGPNLDDVVVTDIGGAACSSFPYWLVWLGVVLLLVAAAVVLYSWWRAANRRRSATTGEQPAPPDDGSTPAA